MGEIRKPNIVVVLADDLAVWAVGCYGNQEIYTPNIDSLAADGIRFTDFFCTSPVCSPARASLLTGKMPSAHGVQDWIRGGNGGSDRPIDYLANHLAYTEVLAENGYVCGISGKWHLGNSPLPQKGYSHWFVHPSGGSAYNNVPMFRQGELVDTAGYISDVITDDAIDFLREQVAAGSSFCLSVNFTAPHSPWVDQHPTEFVDLYADCEFESCPQETRHPWVAGHPIEMDNTEQNTLREKVTVHDHLQGYFAAVTALDTCLGRIRNAITELGIEEDTIVVFLSDNGFNLGHHGIWGKGNATFPQNMYDSSVKVPAVIAMPGRISPGQVVDDMLSGYDLMPTLLELVGLADQIPSDQPGASFLATLEGSKSDSDRPVVIYDEYGPTRMIRNRKWKYVHRYPYGPHELFDLVNDPGERVNLLEDQRVWDVLEADRETIATGLRTDLETWFEKYSDLSFDGRVQAVTGRGQLDLVGQPGVKAFNERELRKTFGDQAVSRSTSGSKSTAPERT